ncbi:hypothetical protein QBC40DRAFT_257519 [Triangularia verruculosa]|uniref:Uncharacterized protein n=1 Tax=Triangularia verruculosa TaxID=2587418 RepID=A0AAN6XAE7_9PEZI|nr:hypothetical protein QBC40DRAFT_257519 [Triangularia verruculosa]
MASSSEAAAASPYVNEGLPKKESIAPLELFKPLRFPTQPDILQGLMFSLAEDDTEKRVFVLVLTNNVEKHKIVEAYFKRHTPRNTKILLMQLGNASSGVGEQPYNGQGAYGAFNRVDHAMVTMILNKEVQAAVVYGAITTIIYVAIESFITRPGYSPPANGEQPRTVPIDYGYILMYNPATKVAKTGVSWGLSVPLAYYNEAQKYGIRDPKGQELIAEFGKGKTLSQEAQKDHGTVTVGEIMAANMEGVDKGNWHKSLTDGKVDRYTLIAGAMEKMEIPW